MSHWTSKLHFLSYWTLSQRIVFPLVKTHVTEFVAPISSFAPEEDKDDELT